jgi:hypothetical protein
LVAQFLACLNLPPAGNISVTTFKSFLQLTNKRQFQQSTFKKLSVTLPGGFQQSITKDNFASSNQRSKSTSAGTLPAIKQKTILLPSDSKSSLLPAFNNLSINMIINALMRSTTSQLQPNQCYDK